MKLSVQPENFLDFIALQSRSELQPFLLTILGMGVSHSVIAAIRLGVFDALQAKPQTASELAQATHCTVTGMQVLLESLDGCGVGLKSQFWIGCKKQGLRIYALAKSA